VSITRLNRACYMFKIVFFTRLNHVFYAIRFTLFLRDRDGDAIVDMLEEARAMNPRFHCT
jgi:hypothetical protein